MKSNLQRRRMNAKKKVWLKGNEWKKGVGKKNQRKKKKPVEKGHE